MEGGLRQSTSAQGRTLMIYDVFWRRHLCKVWWHEPQGHQPYKTTGILSEEQEGQRQEATQPMRVEQTVAFVEYIDSLTCQYFNPIHISRVFPLRAYSNIACAFG